MAPTVLGLVAGLLCLLVCCGLGSCVLRRFGVQPPSYWYPALALVCGVALLDLCVTLDLLAGGGVRSLRILAAVLSAVAIYEVALSRTRLRFVRVHWLAVIVLIVLGVNLFIALAPSSKIDETYYHMLVPARIVTDDGLRAYREPYESAFYPQLAFQIGMSLLHALKIPEAGNVLSWGIGAALIFFIVGIIAEVTRNARVGWVFGGIAAVGIYTSVWHVTSGPHALGDLATVLAASLCLLPERLIAWVREDRRLALVSLACCTSASTKISLVPLAAALTLIAAIRIAPGTGWLKSAGITGGIWALSYLPLVVWSCIQTGSPFGLATASLFHSPFFEAGTIAQMAESREVNQIGFAGAVQALAISVSAGMVLAVGIVAAGARKHANSRILISLVAAQTMLVAILLPHDFRFLGGLQYVALILAGCELSTSIRGKLRLRRAPLLAIPLCLPWLAGQAYYARPFVATGMGLKTRESFIERYIAFAPDFRKLDRILPAEAVLYVTNARPPSFYAPRPVIFTLKDYLPGRPLYRFAVGNAAVQDPLACPDVVYENPNAVSEAFRAPGRPPVREPLKVTRCVVPDGVTF